MKNDLSPKQRRFIAEFLKDQNGTQAAIRAGYSKKTANEQAAQLLAKLSIRTAVDAALAEIKKKAGLTAERILNALLTIAECDFRKAFKDDGELKAPKDMPDDVAAAISSIDTDELFEGVGRDRTRVGETKKIKFWDKVKALELLGKHLKLFDAEDDGNQRAGSIVFNMVPAKYDAAPSSKHKHDKGL